MNSQANLKNPDSLEQRVNEKGGDKTALDFKVLQTDLAPAALGPYVQGLAAGSLVFLSGQLGLDPASGQLPDSVTDQARRAMANVAAVLAAGGLSKDKVIKTTLFLTDIDDFASVNAIYADFFGEHRPARSCVAVAALPKGAKFEMECIAVSG